MPPQSSGFGAQSTSSCGASWRSLPVAIWHSAQPVGAANGLAMQLAPATTEPSGRARCHDRRKPAAHGTAKRRARVRAGPGADAGMGIDPVPVQMRHGVGPVWARMRHGVGPVWARMPARATQEPPWPRTPSRSRSRPGPSPGSKLPWRASRSMRVAGRAEVHSSTRACARCSGTRRYGGRHATTPPPTQGILSSACGTLCQRMYMRHACAPHAHLKTDQLAHGRTQNGAGGHGKKTDDHAVWCPMLGVSGSGALRKRA